MRKISRFFSVEMRLVTAPFFGKILIRPSFSRSKNASRTGVREIHKLLATRGTEATVPCGSLPLKRRDLTCLYACSLRLAPRSTGLIALVRSSVVLTCDMLCPYNSEKTAVKKIFLFVSDETDARVAAHPSRSLRRTRRLGSAPLYEPPEPVKRSHSPRP